MKKIDLFIPVLFLIIVSLIYPFSAEAGGTLDRVHYLVIGNLDEISALQLDLDYKFNKQNTLNLLTSYDGQDFGLAGSWVVNFANKGTNKLNLELTLATGVNNIDINKAIGLSGEGSYLVHNRYFWKVKYFLDNENTDLVYSGGVALPITDDSYLTLGLGNSLWTGNKLSFNIGMEVDL